MNDRSLLKVRAVHAAAWSAVGAVDEIGLHALLFVVLARLLTPGDFGVMAVVAFVIGLNKVFVQIGLGPALIQRDELRPAHISTACTVTLALGIACTSAVLVGAEFVAAAFHDARLGSVLRVCAFMFVVRALNVVPVALLSRGLSFGSLARNDLVSYTVGYVCVGLPCALLGMGHWSLVVGYITQAIVQCGLLLVLCPEAWRIGFERRAFRELIAYGAGSSGGRFANYLALKVDNLVVGATLGLSALGIYSRAYELVAIPAGLYDAAAKRLLFSVMSRVQRDTARVGRWYCRATALTSLALLPLAIAMLLLAPEIVAVLFGSGWEGVAAPLRILGVGLYFRTAYKTSAAVAQATGHVYRLAGFQLAYAFLVAIGAFVGSRLHGIDGVAVGVVFALTAHYTLVTRLAMRLCGVPLRVFAAAHVPAARVTIAVGLIIILAASALRNAGSPPVVTLGGCGIAVLGVAGLAARFCPALAFGPEGLWAMREAAGLFQRNRGRLSRGLVEA